MECKIYKTCPQGRNCSVIQQAEFCGYHRHNAPPEDIQEKKSDLDFIPVDE